MRLTTGIRPLGLPPRPRPDAASTLMCQGGHHAACSFTSSLTEMDRPERAGAAGGPGRVRALARTARPGGHLVGTSPAAGTVRQLTGGEPGRGHGGRRDVPGRRRRHACGGVHQPGRADMAVDGPGSRRERAARRAAPRRDAEPGRACGRALGCRRRLPGRLRVHRAGRRTATRRQLGSAGDAQHRALLRRRRAGARHGRLRQRGRRLGRQLRRRQPLRRPPGRRQLGPGPGAVERQRAGGGAQPEPGGEPGRERGRGLHWGPRQHLGRLRHRPGRVLRPGPGSPRRLQHRLGPEGRAR